MSTAAKPYDLILFGVTGFTGKLAAEYLLEKNYDGVKWAVSARNKTKAEGALKEIAAKLDAPSASIPDILVADLVCEPQSQEEETLRQVVQQTKVVLTCSGPFEKYGPILVKLCAELGVYYADITGETDYFRQTIEQHDKTAQETGAVILCHCGADCIPCDLMVHELHQYAKQRLEPQQHHQLQSVMTFQELNEEAAMSGGTATTAAFQLSKDRTKPKTSFDPLILTTSGEKSEFHTTNKCPKTTVNVPMLPGRNAGPWVMAPVMMNCVRRSNALLGYTKELEYGDAMVKRQTWGAWAKEMAQTTTIGAAVYAPGIFGGLLPKAGEGPSREDMERGFLKLHAVATVIPKDGSGDEKSSSTKPRELRGTFQFNKDVGYLYTAALLCETGMLLLEKHGSLTGGVKTPASALGGDLTQRILKHMDTSLDIQEWQEGGKPVEN